MTAGSARRRPFTLRRLSGSDAEPYRALRLEGLQNNPEAFGASWEVEAAEPLAWFAERLRRSAVFGGFADRGDLAGVAGLVVPDAAKSKHKGVLWGMFVRPEFRGSGLADALVAQVIDHATGRVEELKLTVVASNTAAVRLYERAGFTQYGLERRALKIGQHYFDDALMALVLQPPAATFNA